MLCPQRSTRLVLAHLPGLATTTAATSAARHEHEDGGDEGENGGRKSNPDSIPVASIARTILHLVEEYTEDGKVNCDGDDGDHHGDGSGERGKDAANGGLGDEAEDESDEEDTGAHRVQHEDVGESLGAISADIVKGAVSHALQDSGGIVANARAGASRFGPNDGLVAVAKHTKLGISVARQVEVHE